ncbi:MAG TPA: hypothetical protein VMM76_07670 [Pirellulaceae bacterium]|nr:hypothetical protein [Pirellulaceae bacterium]
MMRSPKFIMLSTVLVLAAVVAVQVDAQQGRPQGGRPQGGRGGGGFPGGEFQGGGGGGKLGLLRMDTVKKELELLDEQAADIEKLNEELRSQRSGDGPDFRNMSDEERRAAFAKLRAEREALSEADRERQDEERRAQQRVQQQQADAKLAEILLPHQMDRLSQIELQTQGIRALTTDEVVKELDLSDKAKADIETTIAASGEKMRAAMQTLFQGGNRDGIREKMEELRKGIEEEVLAKLTQSQRDKFAEMKGEPFEMPQGGFGGPGGQRGRGGEGGRGGDGGGRPQRPAQ